MSRVALADVVAAPRRPRRPVIEVKALTVDLPTDLVRAVKAHCVDHDINMKDFVDAALRDALSHR